MAGLYWTNTAYNPRMSSFYNESLSYVSPVALCKRACHCTIDKNLLGAHVRYAIVMLACVAHICKVHHSGYKQQCTIEPANVDDI